MVQRGLFIQRKRLLLIKLRVKSLFVYLVDITLSPKGTFVFNNFIYCCSFCFDDVDDGDGENGKVLIM